VTRLKGIVFDKDGTLFDFHRSWSAWARSFLEGLAGGDRLRAARLAHAVGFDLERSAFLRGSPVISGTPGQIAELLLPYLPGLTPAALISRINLSSAQAPMVEAVPLAALLAELRARGLRLGLATNDGEAPTMAHLDAAGIAPFFDFVAGFDSGFGAKPDPGPLLAFAEHVGIEAACVAMVGDSRADLVAARAAGMRAIGVLTGPAQETDLAPLAEVVLPDVGALPFWLGFDRPTETAA
jgi:phosphoglycolate phosphatase